MVVVDLDVIEPVFTGKTRVKGLRAWPAAGLGLVRRERHTPSLERSCARSAAPVCPFIRRTQPCWIPACYWSERSLV